MPHIWFAVRDATSCQTPHMATSVLPLASPDRWLVSGDRSSRVGYAIDALVASPRTTRLVALDLDDSTGSTGASFVTLEATDPAVVGAADLFAMGLLGVPVSAAAARSLLSTATSRRIGQLLRSIPETTDLWAARTSTLEAAVRAGEELTAVADLGSVGAGALLARKRPRLVPFLEEPAARLLDLPRPSDPLDPDGWAALRFVLSDADRRARIDALAPAGTPPEVTTLRLLDIAAWASASRGRSGRR